MRHATTLEVDRGGASGRWGRHKDVSKETRLVSMCHEFPGVGARQVLRCQAAGVCGAWYGVKTYRCTAAVVSHKGERHRARKACANRKINASSFAIWYSSSSLCVLAVTAVSQLELAVTQHLPALKRGKILNTNFLTSFGSGMRMWFYRCMPAVLSGMINEMGICL